jgi:lipopolysaccharide exporter
LGANVLFTIYSLADTALIGRLFAVADVGLYSVGRNLALKPQQLVNAPLLRTMQVGFGQNASDRARLGNLFARAVAGSVMLAAPLYIVLGFGAAAIVRVLLGPEWDGSIPLVQILCVYYGARTIGAVGGTALVAAGKARFTMTSWFWCFLTAALVLWLNWSSLTLATVAWAFTLGAVVVYALHTIFAVRYFGVGGEEIRKVGLAFLAGLLTGLLVLGLQSLPLNYLWAFALTLILAPIFHFAFLGAVLERRPQAYLSPAGVKRLYKSL